MPLSPDHRAKLLRLRSTVAGLTVTLGFVRLQRALSRKYDPGQPREPAGGPGGGRWASNGGGQDTSGQGTPGAEETITEDGSRVLSLRIRSQPHQDWDEQHTVIATDGTRTVFEMAGRTQTIRDGETGAILARSTLVDGRAEPEAFLQDARSPVRGPSRFAATVNAGLALLGALSQRIVGGSAMFVGPASEYERGDEQSPKAIWVGKVEQADLEAACPRHGEVQSMLNRTIASVEASGLYTTPQAIGTRVHYLMAQEIKSQRDPNFIAEVSYIKGTGKLGNYAQKNTLRIDILENVRNSTVCIYDPKTGSAGFNPKTAVDYATVVQLHYPYAKRFIVIEMKKNPMTTARQARTIFRPLAKRNPDFAYTGKRELWLTPIRHTVSRVFIDRTSDSDSFQIGWAILATFIPEHSLPGTIGNCAGNLYPFDQDRFAYWEWSDPATMSAAIPVIETVALPHLRAYDDLERWAAYYREAFPIALKGFPHERLILDIALGNLRAAREQLTELFPHFRENKYPDQPIYQHMRRLIVPVAEPLLADDRPALAAILHGWESDNIRAAKLEPYWEPTPFPLERVPA